jgi:glycosyltransferase involved in cell wall biosynthesis
MPGMRVEVVPNSVELPPEQALEKKQWRSEGRLRLIFLSRLHEKKGIDLLIKALSQLVPDVELDIYGSGSKDYLEKLKNLAIHQGLEDRVRFHGHVSGESKARAFLNADLFVLPSHSENFGIAIAEALAHGVPVITTNKTPWTSLDEMGCGRCVNPNLAELVGVIEQLRAREPKDLEEMGRIGRSWMKREYSPEVVNLKVRRIYEDLLSQREMGQAS